jgi:hypothetical protein
MKFMKLFKNTYMKSCIKLALFLSLFPLVTAAQNNVPERLNAYKIGFFTKRLNLSASEAEKFWPVYNDFQLQRQQVQAEKLKLIRTFNQGENTLSDNQISEIGDKLVGAIVKESELAVAFHKKLKEVLPPAKVIRFYQAENQYKMQLLNELQKRQQNWPPAGRQGQMPDAPDLF